MNRKELLNAGKLSRRELLAASAGAGLASSIPALLAGYGSTAAAAAIDPSAFSAGFDLAEASDLLYLCDQLYERNPTQQPPQTPVPPPNPNNWTLIFNSLELGPLKAKWQLWQNNSILSRRYAIIVRGTKATEPGSILEDLITLLIKATGIVEVSGVTIPYKFAADSKASVHLGFALGALLLLNHPTEGILAQLYPPKPKVPKVPAGSNIYIAGHSQGAPVATLIRSYLYYAADLPPNNYSYKTYAFAQPKPGNDHYATDFGSLFSNKGLAYRVTNSLDWIPQVPLTIEIPFDLNIKFPLSNQTTAESLILATLNAMQGQAARLVQAKAMANLQGTALALARTKVPNLVANNSFNVPIVPSHYFVGAATEIALIGTPCVPVPGSTCGLLSQHHAYTYYVLMKDQLKRLIAAH